ncbi:MAG: hypothetical protein K1X57_21455 [Gemmataceae bacterium]|nr:hypothetical protein [Gemmataceae bacterium]
MRYAAGQVWKYHHRPGEEGSRLTVLRIDTEQGYGDIVHIAVSGLFIQAPQAPSGHIREMSHLPFSTDAIDQSVTELIETLAEPPASDGYAVWREAFDKGEAGVFTVSLGKLLAITEQSINQQAEPFSQSADSRDNDAPKTDSGSA